MKNKISGKRKMKKKISGKRKMEKYFLGKTKKNIFGMSLPGLRSTPSLVYPDKSDASKKELCNLSYRIIRRIKWSDYNLPW